MAYMKDRGQLIKLARDSGYKGKLELAELKSWMDETNTTFADEGGSIDVDTIWAKKVTVNFDSSADDVEFVDAADTDGEAETLEAEMGDEDEGEAEAKSFGPRRQKAVVGDNTRKITKMSHGLGTGGGRFGDRLSAKKKAYDNAIRDGRMLSKTGRKPLFNDADRAEAFGAAARLKCMGPHDYSQKAADERIVQKTGLAGQNSTGGALVFYETVPELIENFDESGVMRNAIGITTMRDGQRTVSKLNSDVTIYDGGEAEAMTASDILTGNVNLVASKSYALAKESNELLEDSAFDVADIIGRSSLRALGNFEDSSILLGSNNRDGVANLVGANSTYDATLASSWGDYTITHLQTFLGSVPGWAWDDPNFAIVCSMQFYKSVLCRFALSAGGNTGADVLNGPGGGFSWDGTRVVISQNMPKSYTADQNVAFAGAWSYASKFGLVNGSEAIDVSDQRWFDEDLVGIRVKQRWAFNGHDINNTADSGVWALKD